MNTLKKFVLIVFFCALYASAVPSPAEDPVVPQLGKAPVKQVIAAMTLEEKASLVVGTGMRMGPPAATGTTAPVQRPKSLVPGAAGTTFGIPRLGITAMDLADGPAGLRISPTRENDKAT